MSHAVEVDQSGKIGAKGPTAVAFSDRVDHKILIPPTVKRECVRTLKPQGKTGKKSNAHKKAVATLRGTLKPDRVITTEELLEQFGK